MALIVEDGTGLEDAEAYASVATADAYASAMGLSAWAAAATATKEIALRRATQYIDSRYTFRGHALTDTQALEWPREEYQWPVRAVVNACCELAVRALAGPLVADIEAGSVKREQVGPIETEYFEQANGGQVRFALVDDLLRGVTVGGRSTLRIERA